MKRRLTLAAVVAALAALGGGLAYAETTGTDGAVDACAKSDTGQLRLDTGAGCLPSEQTVRLGASTRAHEWAWYHGVGNGIPIVSGVWPSVKPNLTTVLTVHLDPGTYVLTTEAIAVNNDGQGVVVCLTGNDALGIELAQGAVGNAAGFALQQTLEAQTTVVVPTAQDLTVKCFNAPPNVPAGNPMINLVDVIATKVDSADFTLSP